MDWRTRFPIRPRSPSCARTSAHSGLLRYEYKSDLDWWHVARDILAQEKANYVVMMLGVSDHQNIRERDLAKEAEKQAKDEQAKKDAEQGAQSKPDEQAIIAPEPQAGGRPTA